MKLYIHKHIALEREFYKIVEKFMKDTKNDNFTKLVKEALAQKINSTQLIN